MGGDREEGAAAANGIEGEDYVVVKAGGGEDGAVEEVAVDVVEGAGDSGDLDGGDATGGSAAAAPEVKARKPATKKGGSGVASGAKKGKLQNGKVTTAASAAPAQVKKPGLSQSASFPARGVAGAKKGSAVVAPPKQAKSQGKVSVPNANGSQAAAGRVVEKKANSARVPAVRQSMPVKPESVDSTANDASSEVQESNNNTKPSRQSLPAKLDDDVHSTTSSTNTQRKNAAASGFSFRLEERAEKRKEFLRKLEEKIHAQELEQTNLQEKSKESQEAEIKRLRKSLTFKAAPMPSFYKEQPPKVELKKIPPTRARSPKLGRNKPASSANAASADGSVSCESPRSTTNSAKVNEGVENTKPRVPARKAVQRSVTKAPSPATTTPKADTKPVVTKQKSSNTKPRVARAKVAQLQDSPAKISPTEPSSEQGAGEATGPDLAAPLVTSNEVPVQG